MAKAHIETLNYTLTPLDEIERAAILAGPGGESAAAQRTADLLEGVTPILRRDSSDPQGAAGQVLSILASYAGRTRKQA